MFLGGQEFPDLKWVERYQSFGVTSVVKKTRGGKPWIWEQSESGMPITLVGSEGYGWLSYSDFEKIKQMSEVPNMTYELILFDLTVSVRFRNEDPPSVRADHSWTDLIDISDYDMSMVNVEIKLMVI